ncbi:MAG TPA: helix-turn-helix domain-containing protein [Bacillota bacterium]|nr:helix-turn-helix domain-containing protein [Bacillota bacterium]HPX69230.1 helix-turn-helix domain-containing protein [Bacillota bacterium]HQA65475.1 helix-turn-helix domain-containing protein [Bacillota bacterium]HQO43558.1 helix-turn-helix domain-containing protein [Bacillota bacterium]HQQ45299.1 helix-turn-helix domain-containing protein [Bacillota bacterium]
MDCSKVGKLIFGLRKEKGMTQKQLADAMNISDKTISKWERGLGCPDVSLLRELSEVLNADIEKILLGDLEPNNADGGNMKKIKFYMCPNCGNTLTSTGESDVSCCGRKLVPLIPKPAEGTHKLTVEEIEEDFYITFAHEMSKTHYINFVAYVAYDRVLFVKLYPEQGSEVRFPKMYRGKIYLCCNQHGLWVND